VALTVAGHLHDLDELIGVADTDWVYQGEG
jgi:hypothetical protein